jgi:protein-S-isoprenylcysteine O-methyltransferase Ste14
MTDFYKRGGLWVLVQSVLLSAIILLAARSRRQGRRPMAVYTGATLLGLGAGEIVAGAVMLGRNLTPFPEPSEKAVLVRRGIFSLIRHPVYAGVLLMSAGWALISQSWPALLLAFGLIPFFDAKARREELRLRNRFPEYREYEKQVKRFVPGIYGSFCGLGRAQTRSHRCDSQIFAAEATLAQRFTISGNAASKFLATLNSKHGSHESDIVYAWRSF